MEIATSNRVIIRNIFDFLTPTEIFECRLVCKVWYEEACESLNAIGPFDSFSVAFGGFSDDYRYFEQGHFFDRIERYKNFDDFDTFWGEEERRLMVPQMSFISCDKTHPLSITSGDFPLDRLVVRISRDFLSIDQFYDHIDNDQAQEYADIYMDIVNINRYLRNTKIIVTDWERTDSPKPNLDDTEFPIKTIAFFGEIPSLQGPCESFEFYQDFNSFLKSANDSGIKVSAKITPKIDNPQQSLIKNRGQVLTSALSIAFAGKNVDSAIFEDSTTNCWKKNGLHDWKAFNLQLESFKRNLNFPTNDGRVLGFAYFLKENIDLIPNSNITEPSEILFDKFPTINLIRLTGYYLRNNVNFCLHLIRV